MRGIKSVDVGKRFGRLVVVSLSRVHQRRSGVRVNVWKCRCDCGTVVDVFAGNLTNGITKSCGCLRLEAIKKAQTIHGMTHTPEFCAWSSMIRRCYEQTNAAYADYGGRGITVCNRWRESFVAFLGDMGPRPSSKHSIDRIDNDGPYYPENCRWATSSQQANNRRSNIRIQCHGVTRTLKQWSRISGVFYGTISHRLKTGWPVEKAIFQSPTI